MVNYNTKYNFLENLKTNYGSSTKGLLNVIEPELRKI